MDSKKLLPTELAATAGWLPSLLAASLLVACHAPSSTHTIQSFSSPSRSTVTGKPRSGGASFQFGLIEASYQEGSNPSIENLLATVTPEQSLNWLSQQRGVELVTFPITREGQSVRMEGQNFMVQLGGIEAARGGRATVDARIEMPSFPGGKWFPSISIPAGGVVLLPDTSRVVANDSPFGRSHCRVLA